MTDKVTLRDVYDIVNRLEDKVDTQMEEIRTEVQEIRTWQNKAVGVLGILTLFANAAISYIWTKLFGKV